MRKQSKFLTLLLLLFLSMPATMGLSTRVSTNAAQKGGVVFHWFRLGDLRLHDNPALNRSAKICDQTQSNLIPVFCFDPRIFGDDARSKFGSLKCGPRRAKFVLESVADLRRSLERVGSKLVVAYAKPEDVFSQLLEDCKDTRSKIVYQDEVCSEERAVEHEVKKLFQSSEAVWGSTLYDIKDLPYDMDNNLSDMPDIFTPFRNQVEKNCQIRAPLPTPKQLSSFPSVLPLDTQPALGPYTSFLPTLKDLGYTQDQIQSVETNDPRGVMEFKGGETAALARVKDYIWDKDLLHKYFDTRNGMIGADYSTKFSPWLAHGNLSPRYVAQECKQYEQQRVANKSTYWVVFEMLWRDFFKLFAMKHGKTMFSPGGTMQSTKEWKHYQKNLKAWEEGRTGFPLVDANMRELAATGFMSNRGRQNVCSFLTLELNQDWRYGADYFESTLLDHDVHSNWGNWCSGAGMTGGRVNRFNIVKQSKDYDSHGDYVRHWLPELKKVPTQFVHAPWKMNQFQQMECGCQLGVDYPNPIAPPFNPDPKGGSRSKGDRGGKAGKREQPNSNRSRGQTKDMKSLRKGKFSITD